MAKYAIWVIVTQMTGPKARIKLHEALSIICLAIKTKKEDSVVNGYIPFDII